MAFEEKKRLQISYVISIIIHVILIGIFSIQWNSRPKLDQLSKLPDDIKFDLIYEELKAKEELEVEKKSELVEKVTKASTETMQILPDKSAEFFPEQNKGNATYTGKEAETAVLGSIKPLIGTNEVNKIPTEEIISVEKELLLSKELIETKELTIEVTRISKKERINKEIENDPASRTCYEAGYETGHTFGTLEKKEGLPYKPEIKWNKQKAAYQQAIDIVVKYKNMPEEKVSRIFRGGWVKGYRDAYYGVAKEKTWIEEYCAEDYGGIGAKITIRDEFPTIVTIHENSPAENFVLKTSDKIIKIDGISTQGFTSGNITRKVMGKPDTNVTLTILREKEGKTFDIELTRSIISQKSFRQ